MTGDTKRKTSLLLGVVMLITMMIAANLSQLEFQPGMPLPRLESGRVVAVPIEEEPVVSISAPTFILVLIGLILTAVTLYSMVQLFRGADWKSVSDVLRPILIVSGVVACIVFLFTLFPGSDSYTPEVLPVSTPGPVVTSPPGTAPPSLLWPVGIGLFVISVLVLVWIFTSSRQASPMELVGLEAEKARQALKTGVHLRDVILHCYTQMSLALKQEQGIERKDFMTTGEFENLLETAGVPHEPIHQLTRLFDAVRYGNWQPNPVDEQMAIQCLEAIMLYSRNARGIR
ncbi:MAG TPA: DUF4129 domain-containing protein [Anaerolineales bacterium]